MLRDTKETWVIVNPAWLVADEEGRLLNDNVARS